MSQSFDAHLFQKIHKKPHALIVAGTREGMTLTDRLVQTNLWTVTVSMAWKRVGVKGALCHVGGWGGVEGLCQYLLDRSVAAVVDATHPFSVRISRSVQQACDWVGVPRLRLERTEWSRVSGDRWIYASNYTTAAESLPSSRRVLLTIGRRFLDPFAVRTDVDVIGRAFEPSVQTIPMLRAPFFPTPDWEHRFLRRHKIDILVTKNSGGNASKLIAARDLGIPVVMIERPSSTRGR